MASSNLYNDGTNIGIGTSSPIYPLDVMGNSQTAGNFVNTDITNNYAGVTGSSSLAPNNGFGVKGYGGYVGVYGTAHLGGSGYRYGVYGYGASGDINNGVYGYSFGGTVAYGVMGMAAGATTNWGGFFLGNVYIESNLGIGNGTPVYPLDVTGNTQTAGNFVNTSTNADNSGVVGSCNNTSNWGYGVKGFGGYAGVYGESSIAGGTGNRHALMGFAKNGGYNSGLTAIAEGGTEAYGVYGRASYATTNWAGYFDAGRLDGQSSRRYR